MGNAEKMITAQEAAKKAGLYYEEVTGDRGGILIEEIELDDDNAEWFITLSHRDPSNTYSFNTPEKRLYKSFRIGAYDGEVRSMKIRKI